MYDLIYDGSQYKEELQKLFPLAKIQDASDDIHRCRISIEVEIAEKEYWRIIVLNGFSELSFVVGTVVMSDKRKEFMAEFVLWKEEYPEYFTSDIQKKRQ